MTPLPIFRMGSRLGQEILRKSAIFCYSRMFQGIKKSLKTCSFSEIFVNQPFRVVRLKGLEPPRREAPDPKSGVATNYTTAAEFGCKDINIFLFTNKYYFIFAQTDKLYLVIYSLPDKYKSLHNVYHFICFHIHA